MGRRLTAAASTAWLLFLYSPSSACVATLRQCPPANVEVVPLRWASSSSCGHATRLSGQEGARLLRLQHTVLTTQACLVGLMARTPTWQNRRRRQRHRLMITAAPSWNHPPRASSRSWPHAASARVCVSARRPRGCDASAVAGRAERGHWPVVAGGACQLCMKTTPVMTSSQTMERGGIALCFT